MKTEGTLISCCSKYMNVVVGRSYLLLHIHCIPLGESQLIKIPCNQKAMKINTFKANDACGQRVLPEIGVFSVKTSLVAHLRQQLTARAVTVHKRQPMKRSELWT